MKRAPLALALLLPWAAGCEAKCREVEPLSKVREALYEEIDDRLDEVDATEDQVALVRTAFTPTLGALQRFRAETHPREREVLTELRRQDADRKHLAALIDRNVTAWEGYLREVVRAFVRSNGAMRPEQRQALARRASAPSEPQSTFLLERAVDYFVLRIDASDEQRALIERIKSELLARGGKLREQADALRRQAFTELAKQRPDLARVDATVHAGGDLVRRLLLDLAGYYLLLSSKLDARQRAILDAEIVRFAPCPAPQGVTTAPPSSGT